jgi:16S rRNA (guanine527-N7)-methyltransferase
MDPALLTELLRPFLSEPPLPSDLAVIADYLNLLLRWNARINLTAVRDPNNIVTRHIGESLFAAERLFGGREKTGRVIDVGSGAGFPGLPLKLYAPQVRLTLIESNRKKATFLREAVRIMRFTDVEVFAGRAEDYAGHGDLITMRAVERFAASLPVAASLVDCASSARLGLLIGSSQVKSAMSLVPVMAWDRPIPIPHSTNRVVLVGNPQVIDIR